MHYKVKTFHQHTLMELTVSKEREKNVFYILVLEATMQSQCIQGTAVPAPCRAFHVASADSGVHFPHLALL